MTIERIQPPELPESPLYSHVVVAPAGRLVFVAGQVSQNARGELVGPGDFSAQATQVFENLSRALAAAGTDLKHLVKITIYVTDARFRDPLREVNRRFVPTDKPVSTLLVVAALAQPEYLIEIDAVAALD
ncbi:MAG TPA: RidA family protein [Chloroflexota bacterium]|jgi:enamine deaminase RidA (YjgF/YER057c/UK114 family)|nr:RidA family protein [Chloroflexota bacterium]